MSTGPRLDSRIDNLSRRVTKVDRKLSDKIDGNSIQLATIEGKLDVLIKQNSAIITALVTSNPNLQIIDPAATVGH